MIKWLTSDGILIDNYCAYIYFIILLLLNYILLTLIILLFLVLSRCKLLPLDSSYTNIKVCYRPSSLVNRAYINKYRNHNLKTSINTKDLTLVFSSSALDCNALVLACRFSLDTVVRSSPPMSVLTALLLMPDSMALFLALCAIASVLLLRTSKL